MKIQKYLKQLKKGIFFEAFSLVKKKPKLFFLILLMDALFLSAIFVLGKIGDMAVRPLLASQNIFVVLAMLLLYVLLLVLIYSFTKYFALHFIKSMLKKIKFGLKGIEDFYLLNIIFFALVFIVLWILSRLVGGVREAYTGWASMVLVFAWFFFSYALISIAHSLFALGFSFKKSIKNAFRLTFSRVNLYYGVYALSLIVLGIYFLIYYGFGSFLDALFNLNAMRYNFILIGFMVILLYLLQAYNRVYFYLIVKKIKIK